MPGIIATIVIGIIGGISVGLQGAIAGAMSQRVGGTSGSFIIHLSGAFLSGALLLARGGEQIANWRTLPWYMLGAGAFGVILYITLGQTLPRLGATGAISLIIIGQLTTALLIDHFGLFGVPVRPVDGLRIFAVLLLFAGGYLILR
ncbi:MAG: DMT family transporter [Rudaea sp.]